MNSFGLPLGFDDPEGSIHMIRHEVPQQQGPSVDSKVDAQVRRSLRGCLQHGRWGVCPREHGDCIPP
eukprot:10353515-Lingulodinium_polyedra.AAC.1